MTDPVPRPRRTAEPFVVGRDPLPSGTLVLEASAGTGKTYTIAALACRYIAEGVHTLGEIMMVTFSRAATRELRSRVLQRLRTTREALEGFLAEGTRPADEVDALLADASPGEVSARVARLSAALAESDAATITTTHEFCSRMLSELGLLVDHDTTSRFVGDLSDLEDQVIRDVYLETFTAPGARYQDYLDLGRIVLHRPDLPLAPSDDRDGSLQRRTFATQVREEFELRKRRMGVYTFDDMVSRLRTALTGDGSAAGDREHQPPDPGSPAERAAAILSARFPLVLIDEFQDTDLSQWAIVRSGFVGRSTVVLIGDPKQAIYAFRDADVLAYLQAVDSADDVRTLPSNHRADPLVVNGLDSLFAGAALGDPRIAVTPVAAARSGATIRRKHPTDPAPAVELRCLAVRPGDTSIAAVRRRIATDLCAVTTQLLDGDWEVCDGEPDEGPWRDLRPGDIAVLVRSNRRGIDLQRALEAVGVDSVFSGASNVLGAPAATDWQQMLTALVDPRPGTIAQAALCPLIGWTLDDYSDAVHAVPGARSLDDLSLFLRELGLTLRDRGVAAVLETLLDRCGVAERVLGGADGERRFTDLRHVAELLNDIALRERRSPAGLLRWLTERIAEARGGDDADRTRRLETDRSAVRIMTVHRSKGLEFPVVLVPDLADLYPRDSGDTPAVAFANGRTRCLDVNVGPIHRQRAAGADQEARDEELRTAYVAVTRARSRVVCWWAGSPRNTEMSPLHRIACGQFGPGEVPPPRWDPTTTPLDVAASHPARFDPSAVALTGVESETPSTPVTRVQLGAPLEARAFTRRIDRAWRRTSYSGLTASLHDGATDAVPEVLIFDEPDTEAESARDHHWAQIGTTTPLTPMPGGTAFGTLVHAVLEHVDVDAGDLEGEVARDVRTQLRHLPLRGVDPGDLTRGLLAALSTPLDTVTGAVAPDATLASFPMRDRLAEVGFELPMAHSGAGAASLTDIADALRDPGVAGDDPFARAYGDHLAGSPVAPAVLAGFLTGSIDAVLRTPGPVPRFTIVDYKTNRLALPAGQELLVEHYDRPAMERAMIEAHYPLQALLYCVAWHRTLRWRLPGYRPEANLGGVGYLFVRGMAGPATPVIDGCRCGVFAWHPAATLVSAVSEIVGGASPDEEDQ